MCPVLTPPPLDSPPLAQDVIAGRKTSGRISGSICVNGVPKVDATFARVMGYVEQSDIHVPLATVAEALQFSAALRLPSELSAAQKMQVREAMRSGVRGGRGDSKVGMTGLDVAGRK